MGILIKLIICIIIAVLAFKTHFALGIVFTLLALLYLYFSNYSNLMIGRANAAYANKDYESALKYFKKAVKNGKSSYVAQSGYALMLLRCKKPEEALERINNVLSSLNLPKNIKQHAKQIRALINHKLNNTTEALEEALELYEEGCQTSNMRALLGLLMITSGYDTKKTFEFCEKAYDYDSDNRDIVDNYLIVLINSDRLSEAKEISDDLIALAPEFPESYYHSALLYEKLGDIQKAKSLLENLDECEFTYMTTVSEQEIETLKNHLERNKQ